MSKKNSNFSLAVVFGALLVAVLVIYFTDLGKNERTFKSNIVDIDTSAVNEILIYPKVKKNKIVRLFKKNKKWFVNVSKTKTDNVPSAKIKSLFDELINIKANRVVSRSPKGWKEYEVDNKKAARIKMVENGDTTLDLLIGKFSFRQPRTMYTYLRLAGEKEVYEVEGFLSMTFNQSIESWRDKRVIFSNSDQWNKLVFDYPADSSFQLVKVDNKWEINGKPTDSLETARKLRTLADVYATDFVDDISADSLETPQYELTIQGQKDTIVVKGFKINKRFVISSSFNPGTLFDGNKGKLKEKLFPSKKAFFKKKKGKKKRKK